MESETGEDLGWFWRGWFEHNWQLDLAVQKIAYTDGDYRKGADVTVANLDRLVLPATLEVIYDDGSKQDVRVPGKPGNSTAATSFMWTARAR